MGNAVGSQVVGLEVATAVGHEVTRAIGIGVVIVGCCHGLVVECIGSRKGTVEG